jgi:hypothetical protein
MAADEVNDAEFFGVYCKTYNSKPCVVGGNDYKYEFLHRPTQFAKGKRCDDLISGTGVWSKMFRCRDGSISDYDICTQCKNCFYWLGGKRVELQSCLQ